MDEQLSVFNVCFITFQWLRCRSVRYLSILAKLAAMQTTIIAIDCSRKPIFLVRALQQKSDITFILLLYNGNVIKRTFGMNNLQT